MVGYISVNMDELKIKEYREYRGWYCGLCRQLAKKGGASARLTLSYDMTFLYMLLGSLYDEKVTRVECRCPLHPVMKHLACETGAAEYAADMGILLSYYDLLDDWADEKKFSSKAVSLALKKKVKEIAEKYPEKYHAVKKYIKNLHKCEKREKQKSEKEENLDLAAGYTGEMLGEIFVYKKDLWEDALRRMGFYLGKFIYLMDAWEDIEQDCRTGNYNPLYSVYKTMEAEKTEEGKQKFDEYITGLLEKMAAECCRAFEVLPIVDNVEILRNILYSGIWYKNKKHPFCQHVPNNN